MDSMEEDKRRPILIGSIVWFMAVTAVLFLMCRISNFRQIESIILNLQTRIEKFQFDSKLAQLPKEKQIQILFSRAEVLLNEGSSKKALRAYQEIIDLNPGDKLLWLARKKRAKIFKRRMHFNLALIEYSAFIKGHKNLPGLNLGLAYSYRSNLYKKLGYPELAQKDFMALEQLKQAND